METKNEIVVTGAAGFIGSCVVGYLNRLGYHQIILVDDFSKPEKAPNLAAKKFKHKVERTDFVRWVENQPELDIKFVIHLGARTDTTEMNYEVHKVLNLDYSKMIWKVCCDKNIPLIYASSAATYGGGEFGYGDDHSLVNSLSPLNPYGVSKNEFDKWVLKQEAAPPFWAGLKFFNVFGPNEYHKGRMASVVYHAYNQIKSNGQVKLFRSHNPVFKDGEQMRDFIYVKDVLKIINWLMLNRPSNGLYNVGTGRARTFNDLVTAIFKTLGKSVDIEYVDTPMDIREKYQYFTEAKMQKLIEAGYREQFYDLENAVNEYVAAYLSFHNYY